MGKRRSEINVPTTINFPFLTAEADFLSKL